MPSSCPVPGPLTPRPKQDERAQHQGETNRREEGVARAQMYCLWSPSAHSEREGNGEREKEKDRVFQRDDKGPSEIASGASPACHAVGSSVFLALDLFAFAF